MVYPPKTVTHPSTNRAQYGNFVHSTNDASHYTKPPTGENDSNRYRVEFRESDERRITSPTSAVTGAGRKARQNNLRLSAGADQ